MVMAVETIKATQIAVLIVQTGATKVHSMKLRKWATVSISPSLKMKEALLISLSPKEDRMTMKMKIVRLGPKG